MGANRRNYHGVSRRFAVCYMLNNDPEYLLLVQRYQLTKTSCQKGKEGHDAHMESIFDISNYLKQFKIIHR